MGILGGSTGKVASSAFREDARETAGRKLPRSQVVIHILLVEMYYY